MKRLFYQFILIFFLATLWIGGGYLFGVAMETMGWDYQFRVILAWLNFVIGLLLFFGITKDPTAGRFLLERPREMDRGDFRIGFLWLMPVLLILVALSIRLNAFIEHSS